MYVCVLCVCGGVCVMCMCVCCVCVCGVWCVVCVQEYSAVFAGAGTNPGEKTLEDKFFEKEARTIPLIFSKLMPDLYTDGQTNTHTHYFLYHLRTVLCMLQPATLYTYIDYNSPLILYRWR